MARDGHHYELVDGTLIVTPAPSFRHQDAVLNLAVALKAASPSELKVLIAPFDVALSEHSVLQPDLPVAPRADFTDRDLLTAPLLAVEVLSQHPPGRHRAAGDERATVSAPYPVTLSPSQLLD